MKKLNFEYNNIVTEMSQLAILAAKEQGFNVSLSGNLVRVQDRSLGGYLHFLRKASGYEVFQNSKRIGYIVVTDSLTIESTQFGDITCFRTFIENFSMKSVEDVKKEWVCEKISEMQNNPKEFFFSNSFITELLKELAKR